MHRAQIELGRSGVVADAPLKRLAILVRANVTCDSRWFPHCAPFHASQTYADLMLYTSRQEVTSVSTDGIGEVVMPASKIQDEAEVVRWIESGKTYKWMADEYLRKYRLQVVPSMFSNFRNRKGLARRTVHDGSLMPWRVRLEHRYGFDASMLRVEARRRAGASVSDIELKKLRAWKARLREADVVVHYDAETERGWHYVPRRPGVDTDLIRVPERLSAERTSKQGSSKSLS